MWGVTNPPPTHTHTHFYMPVTLVPNILSSSGFGVHQAQLCVGPSFFFFTDYTVKFNMTKYDRCTCQIANL